jgi:hypothetical protein
MDRRDIPLRTAEPLDAPYTAEVVICLETRDDVGYGRAPLSSGGFATSLVHDNFL